MKIFPIQNLTKNSHVLHNTRRRASKPLTYTLMGLMALGCTACSYTSSQNEQNQKIVQQDVLVKSDSTISNNAVDNKTIINSKKGIVEEPYDKAINTAWKNNIGRDVLEKSVKQEGSVLTIYTNRLRLGSDDMKFKYDITPTDSGMQFDIANDFWFVQDVYPRKMEITNLDNGNFTVTTWRRYWSSQEGRHKEVVKTLEFFKDGSLVTNLDYYNIRQKNIEKELRDVSFFDSSNVKMLSSIFAYLGIPSVDIIENDGYVEIFGESNGTSYYYMLKHGDDNSIYGMLNQMTGKGDPQTVDKDGSSKIYALKFSDKSTNNTQRMLLTNMQVVQNDINNMSDNTKKYGERTKEKHVVDDYRVARGFLGGAAIMATNESTFTTKFLSEGAENIIFSIENNGLLKVNGNYAY